jgi:hypothetical protein
MPYLGGTYGGYIGMTGNWAYWLGCRGQEHFLAYSAANNAQAHTNYVTYHAGVGSGEYWFMGGPGVDPDYNGTTAEASSWGARQAARTLSDVAGSHFDFKVVWMDIELPGITPAPDNGWNDVYTSPCSGVIKQSYVSAALDRADFNGFWDYITAHSSYKVGVYSSAGIWASRRLPVRLVPGSRGRPVRAVLRRADQQQPVRSDVAVVRRRRGCQRY